MHNYNVRYPGQTDTDLTNYPEGKARDVSSEGAGDGTPWQQDLVNDMFGWWQAFLRSAGISANNTTETALASQMLDAFDTRVGSPFPLAVIGYLVVETGFKAEDTFDASSEDSTPVGIAVSQDGTKAYVMGGANDTVYQYSLDPPFSLDSASYDSVSLDASTESTDMNSLTFSPDGTVLFLVDDNGVWQYDLSTAWDLSTASYSGNTLAVGAQDGSMRDIAFNPAGSKMFLVGEANDAVYSYSLTAFDLSTASYDSVSFSVSTQTGVPRGLALNETGTRFFVGAGDTGEIEQYRMTTGFDLSTAAYDNVSFDPGTVGPRGMNFSLDGSKLYVAQIGASVLHRYYTSRVVVA